MNTMQENAMYCAAKNVIAEHKQLPKSKRKDKALMKSIIDNQHLRLKASFYVKRTMFVHFIAKVSGALDES